MKRCFALFALVAAIAFVNAPARAMEMGVLGNQIVLTGKVEAPDVDRFTALLNANAGITTVVLANSPGGLGWANDRISEIIEQRKLDTVVTGSCASACAMMFLAGASRSFGDFVPLPETSLGFHASYRADGSLANDERLADLKARIIDRTGGKIDPTLADRWLHFTDERNMIRFRYPAPGRVSIYFCPTQRGPLGGDYDDCDPIAQGDTFSEGIITTMQITHIRR